LNIYNIVIFKDFRTNLEGVPLAGLPKPVGVRGREVEPLTVETASLLLDTLFRRLDTGVFPLVLLGMRLAVLVSSAIYPVVYLFI
jgi:hypothetical protein